MVNFKLPSSGMRSAIADRIRALIAELLPTATA